MRPRQPTIDQNVVLHFFRIRCWIVIFSNQRLVVFSSCCSIPSVGASHITSHYFVSWAFASCLPFSYRCDILWGRDGIIIDNKPWPANDTRIDCLKGATVDDGREWVTITFSGRIKKSFKVFLLFSLRTYFFFNRLLNAVFQLVYYWSHLGAI